MSETKHPIDKLCEEVGMTRYGLGKQPGLSEAALGMAVKRGTSVGNLKVSTVAGIASALDTSIDDVYAKLLDFESSQKELSDD